MSDVTTKQQSMGFVSRCFGRFYVRTATQPVVSGEKWEEGFVNVLSLIVQRILATLMHVSK